MNFEITHIQVYYLIKFSGSIDRELMANAYLTLLKEPDFNKQSNTIWDFRDAMFALSFKDIQHNAVGLESFGEKRSSTSRSAFIITDSSDKALLQTYITAISRYPVEFKIFVDYHAAINWLNDN